MSPAEKTASIANIAPPALSGVIPRKRLFSLLDKNGSNPVIWLTSPAEDF
jgi:hypothetical protein